MCGFETQQTNGRYFCTVWLAGGKSCYQLLFGLQTSETAFIYGVTIYYFCPLCWQPDCRTPTYQHMTRVFRVFPLPFVRNAGSNIGNG